MFDRITIIGMGLIGGSIAKALKKGGYSGEICGYDVCAATVQKAVLSGCVDIAAHSVRAAVTGAGLVVLAAPLEHYREIFGQIASSGCAEPLLVTDVGSVKTVVSEWAAEHMPQQRFIGGHPMAGSERGGFWASTAHLFENAYYFLTPDEGDTQNLDEMEGFVRLLGAIPVVMLPQQHDRTVAAISHLPHVAATAIAGLFAGDERIREVTFAGGGLRDTTRIASGNPELWQGILGNNRQQVAEEIDLLINRLAEIRAALVNEDGGLLRQLLAEGKFVRDALPKHTRDYLPEVYNIFVPVADQPGIIAELTRLLGGNRLNICEIEILHVRENTSGAIRIGFCKSADACAALELLRANGYEAVNGEKDADN